MQTCKSTRPYLKAKALYLVKIIASLGRGDIVGGHPCYCLVSGVLGSVERQCALPWADLYACVMIGDDRACFGRSVMIMIVLMVGDDR